MRWAGAWAGMVLAAMLLAAPLALAVPRGPSEEADLLPGWKADSYQPPRKQAKRRTPKMTVLHEEARIFHFQAFLTDEECDHIMQLAKDRMRRSGVVDSASGGIKIDSVRTSTGTFLARGEDKVISGIEERIARWTLLPVGHGEGLQVLRYREGDEYKGHFDAFFTAKHLQNGGQRYATVLMYLVDTEEGGETVFPNVPAPGGDNGPEFSECARHHLAAKPRKGDAVLFHSLKPNGELERRSLHTACPVIKGEKWSAPKWIHVSHFALGDERREGGEQPAPRIGGPSGCADQDEFCQSWAAQGECDRNPAFMIGTRERPGQCIQSCQRCDLVLGGGAGSAPRLGRTAGNFA